MLKTYRDFLAKTDSGKHLAISEFTGCFTQYLFPGSEMFYADMKRN